MKVILAILVILAIPVISAHAEGQVIKVVSYQDSHLFPYYQVHILKPGEQPSRLPFHCWGCNAEDIKLIEKETGLVNWLTLEN